MREFFRQTVFAILIFFLIPLTGAESAVRWFTDFDAACREARRTNRAILVLFTGSDWSAECAGLRKEVLDSKEFQTFAREKLILVLVDFPRKKPLPEAQAAANQAVRKKLRYYGGYPGTVLLNKNGEKLGQINGNHSRSLYLDTLKGFLKNASVLSSTGKRPSSPPAPPKSLPPREVTPEGWLTDFEQAKAEARKQKRPILILFTGSDWCGWCKKLKAEVLDTAEFKKFAAESLILLYLDFPLSSSFPPAQKKRNEELRKQLLRNKGGYPMTLILDQMGEEIWRLSGYSKQYLEKIKSFLTPPPPLVKAAMENDLEEARKLTAAGADLNAADNKGMTALHYASRLGNLALVRFLLEKGARLEAKNRSGATPLHCACGSSLPSMELLNCLIARGADLNAVDNQGHTPLIHSAAVYRLDFVQRLIATGVDGNRANHLGQTALFFAVGRNHYPMVEFLLESGADCKLADRNGLTPLHHAAHNRRTSSGIVKLLLKAGADPRARTVQGKTPFDLARRMEIRELLRQP